MGIFNTILFIFQLCFFGVINRGIGVRGTRGGTLQNQTRGRGGNRGSGRGRGGVQQTTNSNQQIDRLVGMVANLVGAVRNSAVVPTGNFVSTSAVSDTHRSTSGIDVLAFTGKKLEQYIQAEPLTFLAKPGKSAKRLQFPLTEVKNVWKRDFRPKKFVLKFVNLHEIFNQAKGKVLFLAKATKAIVEATVIEEVTQSNNKRLTSFSDVTEGSLLEVIFPKALAEGWEAEPYELVVVVETQSVDEETMKPTETLMQIRVTLVYEIKEERFEF